MDKKRVLQIQKLVSKGNIVLYILLSVVLLEGGFFIFPFSFYASFQSNKLGEYAEHILNKCSTVAYRPSCYNKEIPQLTESLTMEEAFQITRLIQEKDDAYWYCHVLAHKLGEIETAKDLDNWKAVANRCPVGMCSYGCLHGAFQERFRAGTFTKTEQKSINQELEDVCEKREGWEPTDLERSTCYHAIGHLSMFITEGNIWDSLEMCKQVAVKDDINLAPSCYDGAFMQIFQPLEPEDLALIEGKQPSKEELSEFCFQFLGDRRGSCWSEGWPLYFEEIQTPQGAINFCSVLEEKSQQARCYAGIFFIMPTQLNLDSHRIDQFCREFPAELQGQCYTGAVSRFLEVDKRLIPRTSQMCALAPVGEAQDECLRGLLSNAITGLHRGSSEFLALCNSLPESWKTQCLSFREKP